MKKWIKKNPTLVKIIAISILLLIAGTLAIGFIRTFLIVLILDIIAIIVINPKKKKEITTKERLKMIALVIFSLGGFVLLSVLGFFLYIVISAPKFNPDQLYNKEATVIYDSTGEITAKLGNEIRETITYDQISEVLIDAIIATEDSRFFQHNGVDLPRFLKASISQVLGKGGGGASTLTMQVAKNSFTSTEDEGIEGIIRKFTDIYLAVFKIEKRYTKEEIIEFYVNSYYMGSGNHGVEQASKYYFNKSAKDMNLAEAAMIAGLFQAPNAYDPYIDSKACEQRRVQVLNLMLRHNYINQQEYDVAVALTVDKLLTPNKQRQQYRDFIDTVVAEVLDKTGKDPYEVPMQIYTTMIKSQQDTVTGAMNGETFKWADDKLRGAAIVIDVKTGAITAVGAGRNIKGEKMQNDATMLKRQIGSTAKPMYDYGPGIEYNNWSTYTPFVDEPYAYSDGTNIRNWDNTYFGWLTLHDSLKYSRNVTALKAFQSVDNGKIKEFVTKLGLSPEVAGGKIHEAHSIGGYDGESPLTVAASYAAFSNGGYYIEPHSFTKIIFSDTGEEYSIKPVTRRAMSDSTAYMITKVLEDTSGYAVGLSVNGVNYCAKTGTTNYDENILAEYNLPKNAINDRWIASYNDSYAIAIWYGYNTVNSENYLTINSTGQKYLFQTIAKGVYTKNSTWKMPDSVIEVEIEKGFNDTKLASEFTPNNLKIKALFKKGLEPTDVSKRFSKLENVTNLNYDDQTQTLSWDPIKTPDFIDRNYLDKLFTEMYGSSKETALQERLNYNNSYIGTVTYDVYIKNGDGSLSLVTNTKNTKINYTFLDTTTFVVKATYSIFKANMSSGTELKVEASQISTVITSEIAGDSVITLNVGQSFTEPTKPIIVLENLTDVTNASNIGKTIIRTSDNKTLNSINEIDTSVVETYKIVYNIGYKNYTNTLTKIIEIK